MKIETINKLNQSLIAYKLWGARGGGGGSGGELWYRGNVFRYQIIRMNLF